MKRMYVTNVRSPKGTFQSTNSSSFFDKCLRFEYWSTLIVYVAER